jgi:hypothetical protein
MLLFIPPWARKWRIKLNEIKSTYINFTNQKLDQRSILLNDVRIPPANTAKCLGMTLDAKLRCKAHIKKKREELQIKFRKMYWPLGRRSELSMYNKLLLYTQCCDQYGHLVSNYGNLRENAIST